MRRYLKTRIEGEEIIFGAEIGRLFNQIMITAFVGRRSLVLSCP
jgi:hypothetical protein